MQNFTYRARSTTYRKTGNKSSMDQRKSSWRDSRTLCEISSNVCWITFNLSVGVNVVLLGRLFWVLSAKMRILFNLSILNWTSPLIISDTWGTTISMKFKNRSKVLDILRRERPSGWVSFFLKEVLRLERSYFGINSKRMVRTQSFGKL